VPLDVDGDDLSRCFSNASLMRFLSISTRPIPALKGHRSPLPLFRARHVEPLSFGNAGARRSALAG
jgi:hypothetical protein